MIGAMRCVALLVLAACSNGGGVQISVRESGTGATQVHLYLGTGELISDTPIFLDQQTRLGSTYASRDPGGDADIEKVTGGHANFFFSPAGDSLTIPLAIAIGFDDANKVVGAGELQDVGVPDSGYLSYDLVLATGGDVEAWDETGRTPSLQSKCVRLGEDMIVSPHDEDCDALLDGDPKECDPHVWFVQDEAPRPDQWTCFRVPTGLGCFAGGNESCKDGVGPVPVANPSGMACPELSQYCGPAIDCPFLNHTANDASSFFDCKIPFENNKICPTKLALPKGGEECWNVRARNDQQSFLNVLTVDGLGDPITFEVLKNNDCDIELKTDGGGTAADPSTTSNTRDGLISIIVADTGVDMGFIAPVHFDLGDNKCSDQPVECSWSGAGSVTTVTRAQLCHPTM